jgi:hypothetical protein
MGEDSAVEINVESIQKSGDGLPVGVVLKGGVNLDSFGPPLDTATIRFAGFSVGRGGIEPPQKWELTIPATISVPPVDLVKPGGRCPHS